jgi:hypothetical protein
VTDAAAIQQSIVDFLRRRRDLTRDEEARRFAEEHLGSNERLSAVQQLEIYREQFWLRHTASLVEDFPGVSGILGQQAWDELIWDYLQSAPLTSHDLGELGAALPAFIAARPSLEHRELLVDMATLEANHVAIFSAPDSGRLDPQKLAAVPEDAWERARLVPDAALRLQAVTYPVVDLRRRLLAARDDETSPPVALPDPSPTMYAVHRRELMIFHDVLEPPEFALLEQIVAGAPLGPACERASATTGIPLETLGENLAPWFSQWSARGYVTDILLP